MPVPARWLLTLAALILPLLLIASSARADDRVEFDPALDGEALTGGRLVSQTLESVEYEHADGRRVKLNPAAVRFVRYGIDGLADSWVTGYEQLTAGTHSAAASSFETFLADGDHLATLEVDARTRGYLRWATHYYAGLAHTRVGEAFATLLDDLEAVLEPPSGPGAMPADRLMRERRATMLAHIDTARDTVGSAEPIAALQSLASAVTDAETAVDLRAAVAGHRERIRALADAALDAGLKRLRAPFVDPADGADFATLRPFWFPAMRLATARAYRAKSEYAAAISELDADAPRIASRSGGIPIPPRANAKADPALLPVVRPLAEASAGYALVVAQALHLQAEVYRNAGDDRQVVRVYRQLLDGLPADEAFDTLRYEVTGELARLTEAMAYPDNKALYEAFVPLSPGVYQLRDAQPLSLDALRDAADSALVCHVARTDGADIVCPDEESLMVAWLEQYLADTHGLRFRRTDDHQRDRDAILAWLDAHPDVAAELFRTVEQMHAYRESHDDFDDVLCESGEDEVHYDRKELRALLDSVDPDSIRVRDVDEFADAGRYGRYVAHRVAVLNARYRLADAIEAVQLRYRDAVMAADRRSLTRFARFWEMDRQRNPGEWDMRRRYRVGQRLFDAGLWAEALDYVVPILQSQQAATDRNGNPLWPSAEEYPYGLTPNNRAQRVEFALRHLVGRAHFELAVAEGRYDPENAHWQEAERHYQRLYQYVRYRNRERQRGNVAPINFERQLDEVYFGLLERLQTLFEQKGAYQAEQDDAEGAYQSWIHAINLHYLEGKQSPRYSREERMAKYHHCRLCLRIAELGPDEEYVEQLRSALKVLESEFRGSPEDGAEPLDGDPDYDRRMRDLWERAQKMRDD